MKSLVYEQFVKRSSEVNMNLLIFLCTWSVFCLIEGVIYESYGGKRISNNEFMQHIKDNTTFWCINDIERCDPEDWRRLGGSCNNLCHPSRGASHTPFYRVLPPNSEDFEVRKSQSGHPLPLVRRVRTGLLTETQVSDQTFTVLLGHFLVFIASEVTNLHDTVNYIIWTPYCCSPRGKTDPMCAPMEVPDDDPIHRFTSIRCLNLTKPMTFQSTGCRKNGTFPERIMSATPLFDMSTVYGNVLDKALEGRKYEGGLLKYEVEDGRVWPPQEKNSPLCILNRRPYESRCHKTPSDGVNSVIGVNLISIWFWRLHNHIADRLAKINPCWDDEKLFYTARDIIIAIECQILYYEILPMLMGYDNLVRDGVLSPTLGFRDLYDDTSIPQLSMEFPLALRLFHKMQEGTLKMYDAKGNYVKEAKTVDLTFRSGFLAVDNNIDYLTQGYFRQATAKIDDHIVDPDMAEKVVGPILPAQDVFASDLAKNRLMFIPPYIKYLEHFLGKKVSCFGDLAEYFEPEVLEKLSELYNSVEDIDLLAAMWVEKTICGGYVPPMFYHICAEQLIRTMRSDRHWYERPNRPHAFTIEQLREIRKVTMARILCDVGDTVSHIQPKAFQRAGQGNEMQSCEKIPNINIMAWKDDSCSGNKHPVKKDKKPDCEGKEG